MENKGKWGLYLGVFALIVSIVAVGIAYAAFSDTLYIDGEATVEGSKWLIKFDNGGATTLTGVTTGTAVEVTPPTINTNDTKISKFSAQFTTPGDSITYTFNVVNGGTFNAAISSITGVNSPTCTNAGTANGANDATNVCNHLTYQLVYNDGNNTPVSQTDTLNAGQTRAMKLILTYDANTPAADLPLDDVAVTDLEIAILYSQS